MNIPDALHWVANKLDRTPSVTANLPPVAPKEATPETQTKIADALRGASSTLPPNVTPTRTAQENTMSTTATLTDVPATPATPSAPSAHGFKSVMEHILKYVTLGLVDVIKYAPSAGALAVIMFPTEAPLEGAALAAATSVSSQILKTILLVQAKYATATPGAETNAAKLGDAVSLVEETAIPLLTKAGVPDVDATRIQNAINIGVAVLKNTPVAA